MPVGSASGSRVYPRVCGGAASASGGGVRPAGLSPRVRGSPTRSRSSRRYAGSIPACAGEPWMYATCRRLEWVYPRVCGGAGRIGQRRVTRRGLSPRVRGSRFGARRLVQRIGSIPACAGEPNWRVNAVFSPRVYPRVCGGARLAWSMNKSHMGLSPRVRGSQLDRTEAPAQTGSIPACAGEPQTPAPSASRTRVYPRVCGGAAVTVGRVQVDVGLSPRVRGSRGTRTRSRHPRGLSPRVRGSHGEGGDPDEGGDWGLSPRVRGSPLWGFSHAWIDGSIPACAGEPRRKQNKRLWTGVYPRVCGGAGQSCG